MFNDKVNHYWFSKQISAMSVQFTYAYKPSNTQ